jgi:hypothetical protein
VLMSDNVGVTALLIVLFPMENNIGSFADMECLRWPLL